MLRRDLIHATHTFELGHILARLPLSPYRIRIQVFVVHVVAAVADFRDDSQSLSRRRRFCRFRRRRSSRHDDQ
jgi:hypothetical protein